LRDANFRYIRTVFLQMIEKCPKNQERRLMILRISRERLVFFPRFLIVLNMLVKEYFAVIMTS